MEKKFLSIVMLMVGLIMLAATANAAPENAGFAFLSPLGMVVLTNLLLFTLFVLLAAVLVREGSSKYYNRIRLREPKIKKVGKRSCGPILRWVLRLIVILAIMAALFFIIYFAIKLAPAAIANIKGQFNSTKTNQTAQAPQNMTNATLPTTNVSVISEAKNLSSATVNEAKGESKFSEFFNGVVMNYGGYVILGFVILIILVSVLGRKINC